MIYIIIIHFSQGPVLALLCTIPPSLVDGPYFTELTVPQLNHTHTTTTTTIPSVHMSSALVSEKKKKKEEGEEEKKEVNSRVIDRSWPDFGIVIPAEARMR